MYLLFYNEVVGLGGLTRSKVGVIVVANEHCFALRIGNVRSDEGAEVPVCIRFVGLNNKACRGLAGVGKVAYGLLYCNRRRGLMVSAYLRFLIFLLAIWIPACASSSPAFLMMYSASKLNKQGDNIQP